MSNIYPLAKFMRLCIDIDIKQFNQRYFLRTTTFDGLTYDKVEEFQKNRDDIDSLTEEAINEYTKITCNK